MRPPIRLRAHSTALRSTPVNLFLLSCRWAPTLMLRCSGMRSPRQACNWITCAQWMAPAAQLSSSCSPQVNIAVLGSAARQLSGHMCVV